MSRRWFRFGKKAEESAAEDAAAGEAPEPTEVLQTEPEPQEAPGPAKKRRRRGSRGGRGRKKTGAGAATATAAQPEDEPKQPARGRPERKPERKAARRRRTPIRRAPLPDAKRELLISVDVGEQRVAVLEDDRVAEVYLERPERRSIAGNIYLGVVDNVLPGMEAAFVEIGLEKNGFLYVDEIVGPELEGRKGARKIQDLIKRGETVLVQAVKDPMKSKGARLTTELSLPGRYLVYVPSGEGSGVSRRLDDDERTRLKGIVGKLDPKGGGIIVRTAAEGASAEDIERDLVFLQRLWKTIQTRAKAAKAPSLVYEEAELPLRIVRDLFAGDFVGAKIDDERTHRRIVSYLKKTSPHMIERVQRYREKEPLFEAYGVDAEIQSTLERRVNLPSGGYLIFDYAEAFTVIDVNTGRFVGSRGKSASGRLEDTIVKNNLEAVKEVVRQLRLRDIGGIIVIDFIDMANPKNRETVEEALRAELESDRTKTYVVEISPLGLVEMTRQNVTDGPREILTRRCPECGGDGFVVSDATVALEVERKLRGLAKDAARVQAFRVAVHPRVLSLLVGPGGNRLAAIEAAARRRFFLVAATNGHLHADHFEVLEQGKLEVLVPVATVKEDQTLELKLVEVGLHDAAAGVGKVDGYDVVVAGAANLVGKKIKAKVGRVLNGAAYATLADEAVPGARITFEAEAEKPTRAPGRKKAEPEEEKPAEAAEPEVIEESAEPSAAELGEVEVEPDEEEKPPAKKRTRRGTRGGRGRKKKAAVTPEVATDEDGSKPGPTIHVPPPDLGLPSAEADEDEPAPAEPEESAATDGQPKRKRTRRGSRGGHRRRKTAASGPAATGPAATGSAATGSAATGSAATGSAATGSAATGSAATGSAATDNGQPPDETTAPEDEGPEDEGVVEYVPMSEWIEDFGSGREA